MPNATGEMAQYNDMSILIVDDENSMVDVLDAVFHRYGFDEVHHANTAKEAFELLGLEHPLVGDQPSGPPLHVDIVLLDIMLPDLMGFEVCLALKNQISPHLPVILMTGYTIEAHHARFVESGADDFLTKPFHPSEMIARVKVLLSRKRQVEEASRLDQTTQPRPARKHEDDLVAGLLHTQLGPYTIEESLSWSGASLIFRARREATGEPCVIKMLTPHALEYPDVRQRFETETRIMQHLRHPNVIRIYDTGEHHQCPYYVMEFLHGRNLETIISHDAQLDFDQIVTVAKTLADALAYIHYQDVIHRDVKPKNVYLGKDYSAKLGDFGIAIILGDLRVTQHGYSIGTPVYMAPEQFDGTHLTAATDIYSYGATLYHLITGRPPFTATSAMEMLRKHLTIMPDPMRSIRPEIPESWDELIVNRCLAKATDQRPGSMAEVAARIQQLTNARF